MDERKEAMKKLQIKERNEKFYTKDGAEALNKFLDALIDMYNKHRFPEAGYALGFGFISFDTKEDCAIAIKQMSMVIGEQIEFQKITEKSRNGTKVEKQIVQRRKK